MTLAELRQFRREGALVDALSQDGFPLAMMDAIAGESRLRLDRGEIRCAKTRSYQRAAAPQRLTVRRGSVEQSNSSVFFDEYGMLKLYRRLEPGPHPEIEMSRFLVERAGFANTPPPLATIELALDGETRPQTMAVGVLFGFVRNQGDGWTQALNYLTRYLDELADLDRPTVVRPARPRPLLSDLGAPARHPHRRDAPRLGRARRRRPWFRA